MTTDDAQEGRPFVWEGKQLNTIRDLMDAMFVIDHAEHAAFFMAEYRKANPHADQNIGYILGYVEPPARRQEMYALFMVKHPIFGGTP